jgi:uncharacterized membrane protein
MNRSRVWPTRLMAAAFTTSGIIHLVRPSVFEPLVPRALPNATEIVYVSGLAELVCAGALLARTRWAGPLSVAVLLAVWPGNFQMAIDVTASAGPADRAKVVAVWARLPLQIPMMWAVMQGRDRENA